MSDLPFFVSKLFFAAFENSDQNLGSILQQSVSDELVKAALKATNVVLASCALVKEENAKTTLILKPCAQVFFVQELCDGVNSAFLRLMRDDHAELADDGRARENERREKGDGHTGKMETSFMVNIAPPISVADGYRHQGESRWVIGSWWVLVLSGNRWRIGAGDLKLLREMSKARICRETLESRNDFLKCFPREILENSVQESLENSVQ